MQIVFGGVLGLVAVVGVVAVLVFVVFGGDDSPPTRSGGSAAASRRRRRPTSRRPRRPRAARSRKLPNEGSGHEEKDFKASDYKQNPPTSGNHFPQWYQDGIYAPGDTPELGKLVHTLEHGRIDIQYKPGTPATTVAQLETLYNEMDGGYHMLLFENSTEHAVRRGRHRLGRIARLPDDEPARSSTRIRAFRDGAHRQGPRGRAVGR